MEIENREEDECGVEHFPQESFFEKKIVAFLTMTVKEKAFKI